MKNRSFVAVGIVGQLFLVLAFHATASATAKTVAIGTCRPDLPSFNTFTDAIAGTPSGSTVLVCPGIYAEQFTLDKNLTITGIESGNGGLPAIVAPTTGLIPNIVNFNVGGFVSNAFVAAQVIVSSGVTVSISNILIDGSNNLLNCLIPVGIDFPDSSGSLTHVAFRNQIAYCNGDLSNPFGDAVLVQSDGAQPAQVNVHSSSFHNPGWMALEAVGSGVIASIDGSTLVGPGQTNGNGIYIANGATAPSITNNFESNALFNGRPTGFWGVLLQGCAGNSLVSGNTISDTNEGIYILCNNNTVSNNTVFNTQLDGVVICGSGNTIKANAINDSGRAGINMLQGCAEAKNSVYNNTVNAACAGTLVGADVSLLSNSISGNTFFNTKYLQLAGTTCN